MAGLPVSIVVGQLKNQILVDDEFYQVDSLKGLQPYLKRKEIAIGAWDMDATASVTIAHGLTLSKIRNVYVFVYVDNGTYYPLAHLGAGSYYLNATDIILARTTGSAFDGVIADDAVMNRGYILIDYIP